MLTFIAGALIPVVVYFIAKGCTREGCTREISQPMTAVRDPCGLRDRATQCDAKVTDVAETEKLTIEAIKKELVSYGAAQTGTKADVVQRLRHYREALNAVGT